MAKNEPEEEGQDPATAQQQQNWLSRWLIGWQPQQPSGCAGNKELQDAWETARRQVDISLIFAARFAAAGVVLGGLVWIFTMFFPLRRPLPGSLEVNRVIACLMMASLPGILAFELCSNALLKWELDVAAITANNSWTKISLKKRSESEWLFYGRKSR